MKNWSKRILSSIAAALLCISSFNAGATMTETSTLLIDDLLRYSYISYISAGLTIKGDAAYCDGAYSAYDDYDAYFYLLLQRSENQVQWTDIQKWYSNISGSGPQTLAGRRDITKGYAYRVIAHVEINGKTAESISPIKQT